MASLDNEPNVICSSKSLMARSLTTMPICCAFFERINVSIAASSAPGFERSSRSRLTCSYTFCA
jgi:hypothetical protein